MGEDVDPEAVADNLAALANPLRIRILLALAETRRPSWDHRGMSYSDLRSAVDVEDGGRFNYHVNELRDQFVRGEEGRYWLTTAGSRVVDEVYARTFSGSHEPISGPVDWTCPADEEQLEATVEDGIITVSCPNHGVLFDMTLSFNAYRDRDLDELFAWANRRALWYLESVSWDVCPHCSGHLGGPNLAARRPESDAGVETLPGDTSTLVMAGTYCRECGVSFRIPAFFYALTRPPAVAFLHDHGIDYRTLELEYGSTSWDFESEELDDGVLVRLAIGDERLEIELDGALDTRSYRRAPLTEGE
ncbi:ArsR/SmtB family transcription factor [Halorussus halobius]|uniref:ArsR/SmtB family transcription factor n=1 Tax=Halorussus halobius TaxID=1710537 RepID=UPI001091EC58|nr:winged helix-turn-helix domain-containing protein [Halorussus halobius]